MAERHLNWPTLCVLAAVGLGCSSSTQTPADSGTTADVVPTDVPVAVDTGGPRDVASVDTPASMSTCGALLGGLCDPIAGTGCASGQGCYVRTPMGGMPVGSCDTPGRGEWGARCTNNNDCREGFACLPTTLGGTTRACTRLCCDGDNAACRDESRGGMPGAVCDRSLILNGTNVHICQASMRCDPMAATNNGCSSDRPYCNVLSMDGTTSCTPLSPMPGAEGSLCCTDGCQPGTICVGGPGTCDATHPLRVCRRVCNPTLSGGDGGTQCPAMQTCLGLMNRPETFGACAPAMM